MLEECTAVPTSIWINTNNIVILLMAKDILSEVWRTLDVGASVADEYMPYALTSIGFEPNIFSLIGKQIDQMIESIGFYYIHWTGLSKLGDPLNDSFDELWERIILILTNGFIRAMSFIEYGFKEHLRRVCASGKLRADTERAVNGSEVSFYNLINKMKDDKYISQESFGLLKNANRLRNDLVHNGAVAQNDCDYDFGPVQISSSKGDLLMIHMDDIFYILKQLNRCLVEFDENVIIKKC